jgi:hypothetical protein
MSPGNENTKNSSKIRKIEHQKNEEYKNIHNHCKTRIKCITLQKYEKYEETKNTKNTKIQKYEECNNTKIRKIQKIQKMQSTNNATNAINTVMIMCRATKLTNALKSSMYKPLFSSGPLQCA